MAADRANDIVLFGATGFTGGLTAEYLLGHAPANARIALAGRNLEKLKALGYEVPLIRADSSDPASLRELAESARVLVSTVGPYLQYGEPLVAACAAAGTGYLDLAGEPEFIDLMYIRHHGRALETGARLIHAAGFDSIPHDLGVLHTVEQMPRDVPLAVNGYVWTSARPSGGTYHSAVGAVARYRDSLKVAKQRRQVEQAAANGQSNGRRVHGNVRSPYRDPDLGWVMPLPLIDPQIVLRSARALPVYGPDFSYGHYLAAGSAKNTAMVLMGAGGLVLGAQTAPTRKLLLKLHDPGTGPTPEQRARSRFRVTFKAQGGGQTLTTRVSGGDPGYGETSKMLSEAALSLAFDDVPETAGQVTTAQALGRPLIDRLVAAGIRFELLDAG